MFNGLRALLIQKDVKRNNSWIGIAACLRALLIQKDVKQIQPQQKHNGKFESFVNSERCKTGWFTKKLYTLFESFVNSERCKTLQSVNYCFDVFESFVNSERCKTIQSDKIIGITFESFVNSERCKTSPPLVISVLCLRALLIQKDVKPDSNAPH